MTASSPVTSTRATFQPVLGWNENMVQTTPVQFSTTFTTTTDTAWTCTNGETRHNVYSLNFKQGLSSDTVRKSNGKIDGWKLTGLGGLEYVGQTTTGYKKYDCAGAGSFASLNVQQSHAFGEDLFVNGVLLPETPVEVPAEVPAA